MRRFKKIILIAAFTVFLILVIANSVFAQRQLEVEYPEIEGVRLEDTSISLPIYVKYIFNFSLAVAGLVVFIILVYAGFRYFTSAGNPAKIRDARSQIFAAFLGLVVLFSSYLILTTINPQLVLLKIPERVIFEREEIIDPQPLEKETLFYSEIPIGGLIEELLSDERLESIKNVAEKTKEKAEEVKNLSEELKILTKACSCFNCDRGYCDRGGCSGNCGCISYCHCVGSPREANDPCPNRVAIDEKREELKKALSEKEADKGLKYWQKKLDIEINGFTKGEEKIIGFKQVYEDLKSAEKTIKNCPLSLSKKGESQILLGYNEFYQYRERLEEDEEIEGVEPHYPFDYISSGNPYYLATFYCAEIFYLVSTEPINIEEGEITITTERRKTTCEPEILIGETVDNTEELARRMLIELDNINNNTLNEIETAGILSDLPEECDCKNCDSSMETSEDCCKWVKCNCVTVCEEEDDEDGDDDWPWDPEDFETMLKPPIVYAACWTECDSCCVYSCCTYCKCVCSGNPCPIEAIDNSAIQIQNNYSEIDKSNKNLKNLIEEKEIEDKLKKSEIFKNLGIAQNQLRPCYNSKETQRKVFSGEKVLWKGLYSCSQLKEYLEWQVFYDEQEQLITECYGSFQGEQDLFDNFFCCYYEL